MAKLLIGLNHKLILLVMALAFQNIVCAQKVVYIPNYLKDLNNADGKQFSWDKTYETDNFILIWGETVGVDPKNYSDPDLQFDPVAVLDTMEYIYKKFKDNDFLDDSPGTNLSKYKVVIVMYNTWGPNGAQGFANGGDVDGVIGAFWVHPNGIRDGGVAAHEFTHSLQAQNNIDYRATHGLGGSWYNAGIFWETHANYMRNLLYPKAVGAWGMDVYHLETWGDWKNTYENYQLLMAIHLSEGPGMISKLWRESDSYEYPLQAYKRLSNYTQSQFNDSLFHYARRMATYDFDFWGKYFRDYRNNDLKSNWLSVQSTWNILKAVEGSTNRYFMPIEQAPEEYAYNVIPLHVESDSCAVIVKFKGHLEVNEHAGWRYGFVAEKTSGEVSRYSETYNSDEKEIHFSLESGESKMYLVVMGAPKTDITTNSNNDTWKGYPKHYRFPYEVSISGAFPEGHQNPDLFRTNFRFDGHKHANGGGWVSNSSNIESSVFVGPHAMVLGNCSISGNVVIDHTSIVVNANLTDNVKVLDNGVVVNSDLSENAEVRGHSYAENVKMSGNSIVGMRAKVYNYTLSGTAEVGGDVIVYNENGSCDNGVQYVLTNYYDNKLLDCDGKTAESLQNKDVNNTYTQFGDSDMAMKCNCNNLPDCKTTAIQDPNQHLVDVATPNPTSSWVSIPNSMPLSKKSIKYEIFNPTGILIKTEFVSSQVSYFKINLGDLNDGIYFIRCSEDGLYSKTYSVVKRN